MLNTKSPSVAIAVFVKTPGFSPIKTRLSQTIGIPSAEGFHLRSCNAIQNVVDHFASHSMFTVKPYWAIAEASHLVGAHWQNWPLVEQGEGTLGDRIHQVYSQLLKLHDSVILLGADAPQITEDLLTKSCALLTGENFVIGPSADGGFYLFHCAREIPRTIWREIPFSTSETCSTLSAVLMELGFKKSVLPLLRDIDNAQDLLELQRLWSAQNPSLPAQKELLSWIDGNSSAFIN